MTRKQLERKYEDCGLNDYRLKSLDNLREIHGFDVRELSGYSGLTDENKMLFDKTVLRFYNSLGMDIKKQLIPKSVNYVQEIAYCKPLCESGNEYYESVGIVINIIDRNGKKHRFHRYIFDKSVPLSECKKFYKSYLRFELKGEWYHFTEKGEWY